MSERNDAALLTKDTCDCSPKYRKLLIVESAENQAAEDAFALINTILDSEDGYTQQSPVPWIAEELPSAYTDMQRGDSGKLMLAHIHSQRANQLLGTSNTLICYVASPVNANILASAAGSIIGGGILVVAVDWKFTASNYFRFLSSRLQSAVASYGGMCVYRLHKKGEHYIRLDPSQGEQALGKNEIDLFRQGLDRAKKRACDRVVRASDTQASFVASSVSKLQRGISLEQSIAVLLHARRGRGKSTALALLINEWLSDPERTVLFSAPSRRQAESVLEIVQDVRADWRDRLLFLSLDDLIEKNRRAAIAVTPNQLLVIDEAAAIATSLLQTVNRLSRRLVIATTTEGYEGSGQGFLTRYISQLKDHFDSFYQSELGEAMRWERDDPLEQIVDDCCGLSWRSAEFESDTQPAAEESTTCISRSSSEVVVRKIDAQELVQNPALTRDIHQLLIDAHYRTRPSDLQQLLDGVAQGAGRHVWVAIDPKVATPRVQAVNRSGVIAVLSALEEGYSLTTELSPGAQVELANAVAEGRRRPAGNLVSQKLANYFSDPQWLLSPSLRISRVATHHGYRRARLASRLIEALEVYGEQNGYCYWSSSYGYRNEVNRFWRAQGASGLFRGVKIDSASGTTTAVVAKALSSRAATASGLASVITTASELFAIDQLERGVADSWRPKESLKLTFDAGKSDLAVRDTLSLLDSRKLMRLQQGRIDMYSAEAALRRYLKTRSSSEMISADQRISVGKLSETLVSYSPDWSAAAKAMNLNGRGELMTLIKSYLQRTFTCSG